MKNIYLVFVAAFGLWNTLGKMIMRCCLLFCLLVAFVACSSKKQGDGVTASDSIVAMLEQDIPEPLKGSWEMSAIKDPSLRGQMEDVDGIVYSMELNLSERTFTADNDLPSGNGKSYGWMDFSNVSRIYHYDIDSVSYLGHNSYRVVSMGTWQDLSVDTLVYYPETKAVYIKNMDYTFHLIPDDQPFNGEWEYTDKNGEDFSTLYYKLSLYKKIKAPQDNYFGGQECYGYGIYSSIDDAYYVIDSIIEINKDYAKVQRCFPDYPEETPCRMTLKFNRDDGSLTIDGNVRMPAKQ